MVLVMESDGSLTATQSQNSFARNYNDGVGQGPAADALAILDEIDVVAAPEEIRVAAIALRAPLPRAEVLTAIRATALRYGSHPGLRRAGLQAGRTDLAATSRSDLGSVWKRRVERRGRWDSR